MRRSDTSNGNSTTRRAQIASRLAVYYREKFARETGRAVEEYSGVWVEFDNAKRAYCLRGEGLPAHPDLADNHPNGWSLLDYITPAKARELIKRDTCPSCKREDAINVNESEQTTQCRFCDYNESPERDFTSLIQPKHTPTPWALGDCAIISTVDWLIEPNASDGEQGIPTTVINLTGACGGNDGDPAFIVKAVNSHDALVSSLRELLKQYGADDIDEFNAALTRAEVALELAEGNDNQ